MQLTELKFYSLLIVLILGINALHCQTDELPPGMLYQAEGFRFNYELQYPDEKGQNFLSDLREISGIQYQGNGLITGIEDECGSFT